MVGGLRGNTCLKWITLYRATVHAAVLYHHWTMGAVAMVCVRGGGFERGHAWLQGKQ